MLISNKSLLFFGIFRYIEREPKLGSNEDDEGITVLITSIPFDLATIVSIKDDRDNIIKGMIKIGTIDDHSLTFKLRLSFMFANGAKQLIAKIVEESTENALKISFQK